MTSSALITVEGSAELVKLDIRLPAVFLADAKSPESPRTTGLYVRLDDDANLGEVEKIGT